VEPKEGAGLGIQLLGAFAVWVEGAPVPDSAWRLRRSRSLIKLLALAPERRLHREQVVDLLWPDGSAASNSLHQVMYTARRALVGEGQRLTLRDDVVALAGDGLWIDVEAFERAAAAAREQRTPEAYRAALALHTGELLPEDRYEDWSAARREALRESHLGLRVELAELEAATGDAAGAIATLQRAIVDDPLHEAAHRALMRLFADGGRRQQALAQYQQLREALRRELEADPDPETRRLYREILAGQHEPEPAAPAAAEPAPAPSHLPRQLTSFVGRERELAELDGLLARTRLLTLTGPGGCGKTRLGLELAARRQRDFELGAHVVELAPIGDPALVGEETAATLGLRPRAERDPIEMLALQIGDGRVLLVLDNCEHLIDACAQLADRLLRECPNLSVLATSRERLRIAGEVAWRVPSLSLPEDAPAPRAAELERSEAIRLFCLRAAEAAPGFALGDENAAEVVEICRRLDGMPLALELAAARAAVLSPAQIAARLNDALGLLRAGSRAGLTRQQTLRATLQWSHDLLGEAERALYRRLGVFAGSFGVEAVEGICAGGAVAPEETLDLLARLAEKSLVQVEPGRDGHRYRLLETFRQDAGERLAQAGERASIAAAHRAWYLALAEAADRDVDPDAAATWPVERVEAEHDNLRAALASAIRHDPPAAIRLANALWWMWMTRSYFAEGARWLDEALAASPEPTPERARALFAAGGVALRLRHGQSSEMVAYATQALGITRRVHDRHAEARALERFGCVALGAFDWTLAEETFAEGLALAEEIGDADVALAIRQAQGALAGCRCQNALARPLLAESLTLLEAMAPDHGPLFWATRISVVVVPEGPGGAPRCFFEDTFCLFRAVRARAGAGYLLANIAETWRSDGRYGPAREAMERAVALFREIGDDLGLGVTLNALGNLARTTGALDLGRACFDEALAIRRSARDPREIATTLTDMGLLSLRAGDPHQAQRLLDEATAIYERTDDGPGLQGIPLNVGVFELDAGDPERAAALLERSVRLGREQGTHRNRGWASAHLGEALIATGDAAGARAALDEAIEVFERSGDVVGPPYVRSLDERLAAPAPRA
jgi:predicted ATPase/DNA-binding SARP family transcriptional activator